MLEPYDTVSDLLKARLFAADESGLEAAEGNFYRMSESFPLVPPAASPDISGVQLHIFGLVKRNEDLEFEIIWPVKLSLGITSGNHTTLEPLAILEKATPDENNTLQNHNLFVPTDASRRLDYEPMSSSVAIEGVDADFVLRILREAISTEFNADHSQQ